MSNEKKTKLAESAIVNVNAYALRSHMEAIPVGDLDGRYPAAQEPGRENDIYPNEVVFTYDLEQPDLIQSKSTYQTADDGCRFVFSGINRMPIKARISPYGISMGTFRATEGGPLKQSIAIEGTFSIPNTGNYAFQAGDYVVGDKPPTDAKAEPIKVSRYQKGRIQPIIYPLSIVKSRFRDIHRTVEKCMDQTLEQLKNDAKVEGISVEAMLNKHVTKLHDAYKHCFTTLRYLKDAKDASRRITYEVFRKFSEDCLCLLRLANVQDHDTFFKGVMYNAMAMNEWFHKNPDLLPADSGYIIMHGKMLTRVASNAILFDEEVFKSMKHKTFAFCLSDAKIGEHVDIFLGRTGA